MKKMYIASDPVPAGRRPSVSGAQVTSSPSEIAASSFNMNQVDRFEEKKVSDLKRLFLEFTKINLIFHSKSIEMFTRCYKDILDIDERADLTEFRYTFKISIEENKHMGSSLLSSSKKSPRHEDDDEANNGMKSIGHDGSGGDEDRRIM